MSYPERSERAGRQGQRRKHHRWGGPSYHGSRCFTGDSVDGINARCSVTLTFCLCLRAHVLQHDGELKALRMSEARQLGYAVMLDELTLEHMAQDCGSLKTQLLKLRTLLKVVNRARVYITR